MCVTLPIWAVLVVLLSAPACNDVLRDVYGMQRLVEELGRPMTDGDNR